ncbi:MAG: hypothetical protein KDK04_03330 [Candidatus Competibacteraceae bacterium]|nr:hypothetical protein [Candidatus Competibacteraceae bacterium]MCB1810745.1 hypothetical protein [Candidatus Competibacteraceae bacterium]
MNSPLLNKLNGLWRRRATPALTAEALPVTPSAYAVGIISQWLAGENDAIQALGLETLHRLAAASPCAWDAEPATVLATEWIDQALQNGFATTLARDATAQDRYLALVQVLCQGLAHAYASALRQGQWVRCPFTEPSAQPPRSHPRLRPSERAALDTSALALWLACTRLPEAGRHLLGEALEQDGPVFSSDAPSALAPPVPEQTEDLASPHERSHRRPKPVKACLSPAPEAPLTPPDNERALLQQAVTTALLQLAQSEAFNRHGGEGWRVGDAFLLCAKPFAERLLNDPWVAAQAPLHNRKTLYRRLAHWGLIQADGALPIWKLRISEPGRPQSQYASVIKLPVALYEAAVTVESYQTGRILKVVVE